MCADPLDMGGNLGNDWILHGDGLTRAGVSGAAAASVDLIQLDHFAVRVTQKQLYTLRAHGSATSAPSTGKKKQYLSEPAEKVTFAAGPPSGRCILEPPIRIEVSVPGDQERARKATRTTTLGLLRLALPLAIGLPICGELVSAALCAPVTAQSLACLSPPSTRSTPKRSRA